MPNTYSFLTQDDVQNYGSGLVDFAQRAAAHAMAPHLQQLGQENAELRERLAVEARHRLDEQVARAIPNYQEVDRDPAWHRWLMTPDPLTGLPRQQLLNDAIASGSVARVSAFFRGFQQEHVGHVEHTGHVSTGQRTRPAHGKPTYTRAQIAQLYEQHRRGAYAGREIEWARLEHDIIAAGREGRILRPDFITK
jgi:hypothetical protein